MSQPKYDEFFNDVPRVNGPILTFPSALGDVRSIDRSDSLLFFGALITVNGDIRIIRRVDLLYISILANPLYRSSFATVVRHLPIFLLSNVNYFSSFYAPCQNLNDEILTFLPWTLKYAIKKGGRKNFCNAFEEPLYDRSARLSRLRTLKTVFTSLFKLTYVLWSPTGSHRALERS